MASSSPCPLHAAAGRDTRFSSLDTAHCTILPVHCEGYMGTGRLLRPHAYA